MVAAQAGDRAAYQELLRDCIPFIRMVARQLGLHADTIDDVVQETLLTIHCARQTYDPNRSFVAWLRTIARRRAIDSLRGHMRVRETYAPIVYDQHPDPTPDPAEAAALTERVIMVGHAISALPAGQREAVEHLTLREQSLSEAAAETGRSHGALKVNLHRALKTLRGRLGGKV